MHESGSAAGDRSLRFRCRGHHNIRALHHKTLEIIRGAEIGPRATCVVGVAADYDPRAVALLSGPIELHLEAEGIEEVVTAEVSCLPSTEHGLVLRESRMVRGNTFAVAADKSARDLSRELARALANPETVVQATLRQRSPGGPSEGALFVFLMEGGGLPSPEEKRALLASSVAAGSQLGILRPWLQSFDPVFDVAPCKTSEDAHSLLGLLAQGKRVSLAVTLDDLVGASIPRTLIAAARDGKTPITCVSEAGPWLRSLAVSGISPWPAAVCGRIEGRKTAEAFATAVPGDQTLVWWAGREQLQRGLGIVAELRGPDVPVLLARDAGGPRELFLTGPLRQSQEGYLEVCQAEGAAGSGEDWVAVVGSAPSTGNGSRSPNLPEEALLRALLSAKVPVKSLARAVATVSGTSKREAYGALIALQGMAEMAEDEA